MHAGPAVPVAPAPDPRAALRPFARPSAGRSLAQLAITAGGYVGGWLAAWAWLRTWWPAGIPFVVITAMFGVRLFILQHDCGHGAFFRSRGANALLGSVLGVVTLAPYHYWRRTHALHHASANNLDRRGLGYMHLATVGEYRAMTPAARRGYRLYRHVAFLVGFGVPFQFLVKHRLPLDVPRAWRWEWASVAFTNVGLLGVLVAAHHTVGLADFARVHLPVLVIEAWIGGWLFWVQHTFDGAWHARDDDWDATRAALEGSSWYDLPAILDWLTGRIGLHHVHHLESRVPNYRLREALAAVPALREVPRVGLAESLRTTRLALWDERAGRLVSFAEAGVDG
jgi:acyl-lipid omega-6 desaturase (Delta-12 desaturase)